ncbi:MAG: malectin domain-containing carbohydrate-binding protein [Armatimonadota bacterium]
MKNWTPRHFTLRLVILSVIVLLGSAASGYAASVMPYYYGHDAVEDANGVIAPWYTGQNGQFDERIRVSMETLKRYPWLNKAGAEAVVPEYLLSSFWRISPEGAITTPKLTDWMNGDRGQLASYVLYLMPDYYMYSGDPQAVAHATMEADAFLKLAMTPPDHPWPSFPISVPTNGKPYAQCDPHGKIQLDVAARVGYGMLKTYMLTGDKRYFDAVKHWADVFAEKCDKTPGAMPWKRWANPEDVGFPHNKGPFTENDLKMTGGVVWILYMLDGVIRLGYTGANNSVVEARNAARVYLRDKLLPNWTVNDTWGRQYWDWLNPVQVPNVTAYVARYMMDNKDYFPNWRTDCRNIMTLCLNHTCVNPGSNGDVYSGAWATPESLNCCGRCLSAGPLLYGTAWARLAVETDSEWAKEITRRQMILVTYDFDDKGIAQDKIDGGMQTNASWFESAHLAPLKIMLGITGWMPETFGPNRENHIVRSSSVVNHVVYDVGKIVYSTFDAPDNTVDVLRLAFTPESIEANGKTLKPRGDSQGIGYTIKRLSNGDCIVTVRHDGAKNVVVRGDDPQKMIDEGSKRLSAKDSSASYKFKGNQFRVIGAVDAEGGLADVYLDGAKQLVSIDCWSPRPLKRQVLYSKSGLPNTDHELKVVARGAKNPRSGGTHINIYGLQCSSATGNLAVGKGAGPTEPQRWVLGYAKRYDYVDSKGDKWWPSGEWIIRSGANKDSIERAWWTEAVKGNVAGTPDPELYRYGIHGAELIMNFTVGPGNYHARLKFAATRGIDSKKNRVTILINSTPVALDVDIEATAGGANRAVDLVFNNVKPKNGIVEIVLRGGPDGEAFVQAVEVGLGDGGKGAVPITVDAS